MLRKFLIVSLAVLPLGLAGCTALPFSDRFGKAKQEKDAAADAAALAEKPEVPASSLLNAGIRNINTGQFKKAQKAFDEVGKQHPFSKEAERSLVLSAYSHFTEGEYDKTVTKADRFIQLYPGSTDAAYMQYLIGESHFKQINSVLLDQEDTRKGLRAYTNLVRLYPDSKFVEDSKLKIIFMNDQLAGKEMQIGRYYQERRQHLAAVNRFRTVAESYQTTRHVEESLYRLTESYLALGIASEAQTAAALLGYNYPDSDWYQDAYGLLTGRELKPKVSDTSRLTKFIPFVGKPKAKTDKVVPGSNKSNADLINQGVSASDGNASVIPPAPAGNVIGGNIDVSSPVRPAPTLPANTPDVPLPSADAGSSVAASSIVAADNAQSSVEEPVKKKGFLSRLNPFGD